MSSPSQTNALSVLRPVAVLVCVCAVSGVLLGAVHGVTQPLAEENAARSARETYATLVEGDVVFEDVAAGAAPIEERVPGCTAALRAVDATGETVAYVVVAEARGYGGAVPVAVAFDPDGTVRSLAALPNDETPGLGTKVASASYLGQYEGREAQPLIPDDIDFISGATISSKAALAAFNTAVEAFQEVCS